MNIQDKLEFYASKGFNVLLKGRHGCGKTSVTHAVAKKLGMKIKTLSASTIDPWIHLVGVPEKFNDEEGLEYLKMVMPEYFVKDGGIEILFLDEYNRSNKMVRNACMELLQFKSINGIKLPSLKMVWAAVNPDDDEDLEYDVEPIDPAQLDRFHVNLDFPYKPNYEYFKGVYGEQISQGACHWWNKLTNDQQLLVSPRRLDYALEVHQQGGDLVDVLPKTVNANELYMFITEGDPVKNLEEAIKEKDEDKIKNIVENENTYHAIEQKISKNKSLAKSIAPFLNVEKLVKLMKKHSPFRNAIVKEFKPSDLNLVLDNFPNNNTQYMKQIKGWFNRFEPKQANKVEGTKEELLEKMLNLYGLSNNSVYRGNFLGMLYHIQDDLDDLFNKPEFNKQVAVFDKLLNIILIHSNNVRYRTYEDCISKAICFLENSKNKSKRAKNISPEGYEKFNDYYEQNNEDILTVKPIDCSTILKDYLNYPF